MKITTSNCQIIGVIFLIESGSYIFFSENYVVDSFGKPWYRHAGIKSTIEILK